MPSEPALQTAVSGVVVVLLVDLLKNHRSWGWMKLAQGVSQLRLVPGALFCKVMGSGHEGGFGLRPSATHQGLIMVFDHPDSAQAFLQSEQVLQYKQHAREWWSGILQITSSRGQWNQVTWQAGENADGWQASDSSPVATLTRASIRPTSAMAFWRYAPPAQADLDRAPGCILAMGLGEAPLVRQCTFSVWRNTQAMLDYAQRGAHQTAIQAAYKHQFFSESMFVRMQVLSMSGVWKGVYYRVDPNPKHGEFRHA